MKSTKEFYKNTPYTWQTNVDELFKFAWSCVFRSAIEKFSEMAPGDVLLDVGCGSGDLLDYVTPKGKYLGIDISPDNITEAKKRHPGHEFQVMDATSTSFKDNAFKYIVCVETIEHLTISELEELLREWKRILAPDGKVVITTPNLYYLWGIIPWSFWPIKRRMTFKKLREGIRQGYIDENYNLPSHHYRFRPSFLEGLCGKYFEVKSIGSTYWYNNRAVHGIWPNLQMKILKFTYRHSFLGSRLLGSQLVIELKNSKK